MEKKKINIKNIDRGKIVLLVAAGIILIMFSYFDSGNQSSKSKDAEESVTSVKVYDYAREMEEKVKNIIESINGISEVHVVITLRESEEAVVKEDLEEEERKQEDAGKTETDHSVSKKTVILSKDGTEEPYIVKEICPSVRGIAVTAKGVSDVQIRQELINMLSALFDVPVHKITIINV